ncbi:pyrroline-5-carboxylate reductase [Ruminococcus albus]|uniref:Pyrroline-5-carboxylate reductase n=1 Tax=Ruminococcus albus 8 TaxID=246199 RepID=E9SD58_RUMAL|nr:pyrroline-5-carboxylate reductase [Ruminococcus albus]EGC02785.1 pyrroline-5-carboxylate reductase [Ruminococcus albus 8]MCC3352137.1 pyrroline-5-carboxylate reductase [Ruminococcus albus 8]
MKYNVGFIGAGNMGFAIMKGITGSSMADDIALHVFDPSQEAMVRAEQLGAASEKNSAELVSKCGYIFLAVKPQQLDEVLADIKDEVTADKVIVSICAGITDDYIASKTIAGAKVVMVMPNTPLLLGEGATALAKSDSVSENEFGLVCSIFGSCGIYSVLPKDKMKEVIAINGSSPAFIYLYAQSFIEYAKSVGIDEKAATDLFAKSLIGSAKMITDSGRTIDELITMVSSKGGTTIAGLEKLRENDLDKAVRECCEACTKRAYELSK